MASPPCCFFFLFLVLTFFSSISNSSSSSPTLSSICNSTPYPNHCLEASKLSLSITLPHSLLSALLRSLDAAIYDATKLSSLLSGARLVEARRGALQDCIDLQDVTLSALQRSSSLVKPGSDPKHLPVARAFLSAALTNRATCLEGLDSASGPLKPALVSSVLDAYKHVSNSLSLLSGPRQGPRSRRRTLGFPSWARRAIEIDLGSGSSDTGPETGPTVTVAKDGTGNFTTVGEAVEWAPSWSAERTVIYVREGVYEENVEIPRHKTNIMLVGDGSDATVITWNRSVADGWTTFRSATLAVSGDGFLGRDMTFENSAGASKHQAVALRINSDLSAVYRCSIVGYQDSLYVHSFRQFYRECDIYGTVDFIFGNAIVVLQASNIFSRLPLPGQFTVITAQSRDSQDEITGIVIQNCSILASDDLYNSRNSKVVRSYLGRPWKPYARTVVMESYIDDFVDPAGWTKWSGDQGLDTLYYGEYGNDGPGSGMDGRVSWPGYHPMEYEDAINFTVSEFIMGDEWLQSTTVPYDDGV
ncbi:hypothetical protein V2J09_021424 [Rumex salicifolius]